MKEGWEYIALSSVCKVQNGFAFNSKLFNESNNGLPLIRIRDIKRGYSLTYTDEPCSDDFFVEDGDMLIGMDGDFNIGEWKGGHALLNQRVCKLIPSEKILAKFIFYFIPEALQRINDKTAFSTVKHLSSRQVNAILLPNLPLSEQQSIVKYLDSSFAKIDTLKANAAKNLDEAKALFQSALKEALEPKKGWEEKMLGTLGTLKNGMNFSKNESGTELHILGISDFGNLFSISNTEDLSVISLNEMPSEDYLLQNEDVVFVRSNGNKNLVGRCVIVYPDNIKTTFSGFCIRFRKTSKEINTTYLVWFLKASGTRKKIVGNGANISNLNQKILQSLAIPIPPLSEQQEIVSRLDSLNEKVNTLQQNYSRICSECDALKQAILRQVFE